MPYVKEELASEPVPAESAGWLFTYQVQVKEEVECSGDAEYVKLGTCEGDKSAATLYTDHDIQGEIVLGPKQVQRPSVPVFYAAEDLAPQECWKNALAIGLAASDDTIHNLEETVPPQTINTIQDTAYINAYVCDSCGKEFQQKRSLIRHIKAHLRKSIPKSEKLQKPYTCDICNKVFTRSDHLKTHERTHSGVKPYSCEICLTKFADQKTLKTHKQIHTGEKPYSCETCKQKFTQLGNLKRHTQIHTGEKRFCCDVCSKWFISVSDLKRHKRIHTGDKPYSCEICKKGFAVSSHLKRHKEIHKREKSFLCDICEMRFIRRCHLDAHKRTHARKRRSNDCFFGSKETKS